MNSSLDLDRSSAALLAGNYFKAGLILLTLSLFATAHLVHYAMGLMALAGMIEFVRRPSARCDGANKNLLLLFLLIWLPMVAALPGAVAPAHSRVTVTAYLHYLPAAYFVMSACADVGVRRLVTHGAALLITFVALDAFAQLIWHRDLFGFPYEGGSLRGVFYPKQRLGLLLGVFAALHIEVVLQWCRRYAGIWILLVPLAIVIVMSLKRAAWIMLVLGLVSYFVLRWQHGSRWRPRNWLIAMAIVVVCASAVAINPTLQARLIETSGLFSRNSHSIDSATAYRWSLWQTGSAMVRDHWLLGIGPRGFRHAYKTYAAPNDFWILLNGHGQTHPHLFLLEVLIETGAVGLAGLLVFFLILLRTLFRADRSQSIPVWLLGAVIASFPLNAHMAFYSAYWSTLVWLLLGVGVAEVYAPEASSTNATSSLAAEDAAVQLNVE